MAGHVSTLDLTALQADIDALRIEMEHESDIFPDGTALKCELTAGSPANTWSSWAEIVDDTSPTPITFSSLFASQAGHISGLLIEDLSHHDKRYELCVAYSDAKVCILLHRFLSGDTKKLAAVQFVRIRAESIPAGETVYYKMRCEEAAGTCEVSFRYHFHVVP